MKICTWTDLKAQREMKKQYHRKQRSMSQQCTACSERPKTVNQGRHAVQSENSSINTPCYFPGNTTRKALSEIIGIKKCCTVNELDQATQFLGGKSDLDRGTTMALRSKMPKNLSLSRVNRRNRFGETLLHLAVMDEDIHLVREILKIGACPSEADYAGWTPLHVAAAASHYDIVVTLLEAGAVVNFSGDKGVTPLHDAIESGNYKIVELLLSSGADPLQRTDDGRSALDMTMDATLRKLIERYQPKANQSSPGQCELWKWCCQDGSKVAKSALNSDARASSCSGGFSPKKIACNKNQESFGVEALLKCRDSMTAGDKDAVLSKPAIVFNKARNGQVIAEGTEEDGQDSDSTPAITADNEKEQSELSLSQNNESIIMCTEDLLGNLRNSDGNLVADGGEQFIHQISEDKAQECPESFTAYLEEAAACCRGRSQMKEQNDLQTNVDLEQHKDGKNETVRCDLNIKQNFGCQTAKPMRNPKIDPEDDANENMDECSISLLCPYARDSDLPCAPKAWHGLNACEGERLSTASNSTPSIKGSSSFSDGSTPSLLLEQSRSYDGISASDSCKTSTAELPVLQHEVSSFGEKYDIALSGRNSESFEIKKQSVEPLIARENKKNSTEVNQTLLEQQDNNRCEPTECMEHIEMAEMIRLLSDSELSNLSNPETPYPEKDALICVPVNVENFCNSLEDDCGALLALRGSGSCGSRALSQEKGCDITKWLLDSNTQVGSPKAIECVDLICQTIEDISQGAIEKAGLQCGQELLNQQAFSCQSEFHISGQVSENVVYDNSGSVSKKGLLESENNLSPHVVMSASENLLHDFSCSSSKSQPVCHDTQNDDENCSFDSDCTYVSESYFLKGTKTENLNNDSLNSGTSQDSSNKNFKRHSKKHHDKFGKGSDQQKGKLLQDNVSNVDSIYIREDCDPTNQSANILKSLPSGSDSINPVPCSGHQVQLRRKSASQRTCCMDHLTEVLPSKKRRSSKKVLGESVAPVHTLHLSLFLFIGIAAASSAPSSLLLPLRCAQQLYSSLSLLRFVTAAHSVVCTSLPVVPFTSLLVPCGPGDLPCAPKAWHGLNACEGERLSTASNSTPSIKGSSSFSDGSTPSLLLEQSRSYDGISASDSCKTSTAELPVLQHEVSSFGEKYDIALSGRNSESFEIKKQSVEPLIARENKKNSTEVNQTLLEQQDNNRCEPTECMEHIEMAEMIRLLSDSELSNLSNPETPYPEKDALICVPVNVENFCNSLEDDCGALLALRGSGSCGSRALSQEKGCDITKWLLDSNTQVGSPKAIECVDLICQTIEDISQGAIEKAGLQCGQELLNQQAFSCQSEFHISGQVSENVVYDNSGSVSKKGLLESENNLSPHVVMSASENLLHDFSCSSSKSQPVCHDTQNDDENCSFDSDCTYVSESYFLKGTKTENLNNDSLNSGTSQDSSNKNFKRHSKKHHDKFGKGSDQQKGKLLQDNVSNVDSIYIREDCDPTNQSANILKSLPSGSDSINPVPCSGHQVQLRRKSASQRTCCMDHLTEVLPSKKRRSSKKFQSTSSTLDKVRKKQDEMLAMDLTDPEDTGKFTEAFAQIQTLLSDVLNKHKAENENLTRKYRIASDSFKHGTLREQLSSLSSRQKHLLDILQRQNNLRVRFQMFHSRSFEGQTTAEAPWTSMNVCDAETVHKTQWRDCRTGTLEQLSEDDCSGFSSALSLCSEAVSRNCSDQTQVTLGISHAGPQFSVNELRTDSCTFFDSFVNVDNQAGVPPSFTVQASPVAVHTENIQSQIKVPSELAYLIKQGTIKPGENVFRLKLKGNCHTASLQENGSIKDTGGQVYISPEQWIGSVLGPSVPMSPTYAWKKVTYRSKPLLGYVRKAGPVAGDSTASLQNCPSKATPPGDLLKEVCTESPIGDLMKIQTILLVSDSEFINNYELDQHWNRLLESDDWTI